MIEIFRWEGRIYIKSEVKMENNQDEIENEKLRFYTHLGDVTV
jgi:hypothetical protein